MNKLVAFTGGMGCGKSTAIDWLANLKDHQLTLVKFAGPLYDIQNYIYEVIAPAYTKPKDFVKDRKLLQWLGTEWGRGTISPTLWVDLWKDDVEYCLERSARTVVCDDCRFDNEAEAVRGLGGKIIRIVSDKAQNRIDTKTGISNHSSEQGIAGSLVDATVVNNGTLEEYYQALTRVYKQLGLIE